MPKDENDKTTEKPELTKVEKNETADVYERPTVNRSNKPWIIVAIIVIAVLIVALIGSMFRLYSLRQGYYNNHGGTTFVDNRGGMPHMRGSFYFSSTNSNGTSSSSTSVISGVVTKVNGSSFDVGGGGSKTTVNTSGSTAWNTTDKKVSVNDSVVVYGTVSGDKITASSVQISNL